ncbi:Uncharacterised protein [Mycobacteroides abscessus subsp. massiliense]|nr:Uncharacterised protein [Mycobacteroides abscessus subsp. massiliense]
MVDVVGQIRCQRAERIVRECRQVDHRIKACQLVHRYVAKIHRERRRFDEFGTQYAIGEKPRIQTNYIVTGLGDHLRHHGAEIALMTGDENLHCVAPREIVAFSSTNASAYRCRHCTPRTRANERNVSWSNQSWGRCDG